MNEQIAVALACPPGLTHTTYVVRVAHPRSWDAREEREVVGEFIDPAEALRLATRLNERETASHVEYVVLDVVDRRLKSEPVSPITAWIPDTD